MSTPEVNAFFSAAQHIIKEQAKFVNDNVEEIRRIQRKEDLKKYLLGGLTGAITGAIGMSLYSKYKNKPVSQRRSRKGSVGNKKSRKSTR